MSESAILRIEEGYVATPGGRLFKYDPATGKETIVSKSIPFYKNYPKVKKGQARTKK